MRKQFILLDCAGISPGGMHFPAFSINLLSMASYICENTDWEVKIIMPVMDFGCPLDDQGLECIEDRVVAAAQQDIREVDRIVFGFSIACTEDIIYALPLAQKLKEAFNTSVLYGGFAPTMAYKTICEDYSYIVDAVIVGIGEHVCVELFRQWEGKGPVPEIPGVAAIRDKVFGFTPQPVYNVRPFPVRLHMDVISTPWYYRSVIYNSSYGCLFKCRFCIEHYINPGYFSKSLDRVRLELNTLAQYMRTPLFFLFTDALFDFRDNRAAGITDICKDLDASYFIETHVDTTPFHALPGMGKACRSICYGLEHGSQEVLNRMKKTENPKRYLKRFKKLFRITTENNIMAMMSVIINYPGTHRKDVNESIRFLEELFEDYYTRFRPGEGPHYMLSFPFYRQAGNDFQGNRDIREFDTTGVTWRTWFKDSYRGFPVRSNLLRIVKDPSGDLGEDEIREIIRQLYKKAGIQTPGFLKNVEKHFPIMNHRLWMGGDFIRPFIDEENSHVLSMKKLTRAQQS